MRLIILGAGTGIPAPGYNPAGLYIEVGRERILLDAGAGTLQRLALLGVDFLQINRLFITHFHIDHCLDLVSLLFARRIPSSVTKPPLTVYGPRGLRRLTRQLNTAFHGWFGPRGYRLALRELRAATLRLPGYTVTSRLMNHYDTGAIGYRITAGGKSLAYSGDTDMCRAIVELGYRADALILECSVPDERKAAGHLTPSDCGRIAAEAGCRHLILTHFYPVFQRHDIRACVRRFFRGRLTLARDFISLRV